jgi:hypothetical protein
VSNPYRDKLLGIGVISKRTRTQVSEGRQHPETGVAWKATTEPGSGLTTTEHNTKDDRVDALVRPKTVRAVYSGGKVENRG